MTEHPPPRRSPMARAPRVDDADRPTAAELDDVRADVADRRRTGRPPRPRA